MNIFIQSGQGSGPTELSAFDRALVEAQIANFNLIYLSSVLPPASEIKLEGHADLSRASWGDRLYVVMAQQRTSTPNEEAWAGVGWIQDESGRGLLVEHEGHTEEQVKADITHSLEALAANRGMQFGPIQMRVHGIRCIDRPVCALVVAVFESEGWSGSYH